jgi:hypothetical protein
MGKVAEKLKEIKHMNKEEWKNMPEYKFTVENPIRVLKIKFKTIEDLEKFEKLLGQKIDPKRNTYWYPEYHESLFSNMIYVDEKDEDKDELKK